MILQDLVQDLTWSYQRSCQDHVKILAWFHQDLVKILPRFPTWEINVIIITSQQHDNSDGWRNSIDHTFCNRTALVHKAFTKTCRSRKASSACSCLFFSFTPPKFSSHTCCKVAAILFTKILAHSVNHLGRGASLQVMLMCWWMTDDHHPDQSFARHQNAGHPKCCTKPLLSLLLRLFNYCNCYSRDFSANILSLTDFLSKRETARSLPQCQQEADGRLWLVDCLSAWLMLE